MVEEIKSKVSKSKYDNIELSDQPYKHHKVGEYTCESEVKIDGELTCCLHDPVATDKTKAWKYVKKEVN